MPGVLRGSLGRISAWEAWARPSRQPGQKYSLGMGAAAWAETQPAWRPETQSAAALSTWQRGQVLQAGLQVRVTVRLDARQGTKIVYKWNPGNREAYEGVVGKQYERNGGWKNAKNVDWWNVHWSDARAPMLWCLWAELSDNSTLKQML